MWGLVTLRGVCLSGLPECRGPSCGAYFCAPYSILRSLGAICVPIGCKPSGLCSPLVLIRCRGYRQAPKRENRRAPAGFRIPPKNGLKQPLRLIHGSRFGLARTDRGTSAKQIKNIKYRAPRDAEGVQDLGPGALLPTFPAREK